MGEYIYELLVLFHRGENKQATEEIHSFPSLKLSKHERTRNSLKTAHDIFSAECTIEMVRGLTPLKHYGAMALWNYGVAYLGAEVLIK